MATPSVRSLVTADEFMQLPDPEDGSRLELVRGHVVHMPPPGGAHGSLSNDVAFYLTQFVKEHSLGVVTAEVTLLLESEPDSIRVPDAAFFARDDMTTKALPDGYVEDVLTLVVEIVSVHDRDAEITDKLAEYFAFGIERVWIVRRRNQTITAHRRDGTARTYGADDTLTSDDAGFSVSGFELPVARLFA